MAALLTGKKAPHFALTTMDGSEFSLGEALAKGPVLLAFFKISCPVCQYTFPFLERMHKALSGKGLAIVGVSQDNPRDTALFVREYGITFPVAIDDSKNGYAVSNAFGLTNVPTLFDIQSEGTIVLSSSGWSRAELEEIYARHLNGVTGAPQLFQPGERVSDFRAG